MSIIISIENRSMTTAASVCVFENSQNNSLIINYTYTVILYRPLYIIVIYDSLNRMTVVLFENRIDNEEEYPLNNFLTDDDR